VISSGNLTSTATDRSTVEAFVGAETTTTSHAGRTATVVATGSGETIDITASLTAPVKAEGDVLSISLGANSKTVTEATATQVVRAYVGDGGEPKAEGGGDLNVAAFANTQALADGTGVSAALGVSVGGATSTATVNPTVQAFTEGTTKLGGRDVLLTSRVNVTDASAHIDQSFEGDTVAPAFATVTLGSGALLASVAGGTVDTYNSPIVYTGVGAGGTVTATRDVKINSVVYQRAQSDGLSIAAALGVGVGITRPSATAGGSTTTFFDGELTGSSTATVRGFVEASTETDARAVGVGALSGITDVTSTATTSPTVATSVGGSLTATNRPLPTSCPRPRRRSRRLPSRSPSWAPRRLPPAARPPP